MSAPSCPECAVGKHANCDDMSWDTEIDAPAACPCFVRQHQPASEKRDWTEEEKRTLRDSIGWWSGWLIGAWDEPLSHEQATALATDSIEEYIANCDPG